MYSSIGAVDETAYGRVPSAQGWTLSVACKWRNLLPKRSIVYRYLYLGRCVEVNVIFHQLNFWRRILFLCSRDRAHSPVSTSSKPSNTNPLIPPAKQALVEKSHGEYWLQVSAQRLLKVECAEAQHVPDMAKLEACIEKVPTARQARVLVWLVWVLQHGGPSRSLRRTC